MTSVVLQASSKRLFQHGNSATGVVGQIQRNYRRMLLKQSQLQLNVCHPMAPSVSKKCRSHAKSSLKTSAADSILAKNVARELRNRVHARTAPIMG